MSVDAPDHLRWPPERFYWAELDTPAWRRGGPLPEGLLAELADEIPVPIEEVHAVGAPRSDGKLVVCAASRRVLEGVAAGDDPGGRNDPVSLTPERLPPCVQGSEGSVEPEALQLLTGPFEPRASRLARRRLRIVVGLVALASVALVSVGLERRTSAWSGFAEDARETRREVLETVVPGASPSTLVFQIERMRAEAEASKGVRPPIDASLHLASLLRAWPSVAAATPQSISVTEDAMNLSVAVEGDPAEFLAAFSPPDGWVADDPRLNAARGVTRLTIRLRPGPASPTTGERSDLPEQERLP